MVNHDDHPPRGPWQQHGPRRIGPTPPWGATPPPTSNRLRLRRLSHSPWVAWLQRAAHRSRDWLVELARPSWYVPPGGTTTPRWLGVASVALVILPPGFPMLVFGMLGGLVVSYGLTIFGIVLGLRGDRLATAAQQSVLWPRTGWMLGGAVLILGCGGCMSGLTQLGPHIGS